MTTVTDEQYYGNDYCNWLTPVTVVITVTINTN